MWLVTNITGESYVNMTWCFDCWSISSHQVVEAWRSRQDKWLEWKRSLNPDFLLQRQPTAMGRVLHAYANTTVFHRKDAKGWYKSTTIGRTIYLSINMDTYVCFLSSVRVHYVYMVARKACCRVTNRPASSICIRTQRENETCRGSHRDYTTDQESPAHWTRQYTSITE